MSRLTKAQRETVRQMFGGRCAYCGEPLPDRWHVDHVEPVHRKFVFKEGRTVTTGEMFRPENDTVANFMPSCPPCNISKHSMTLDVWRGWLAGHVKSLNAYHPIYRLAKRYGLVHETGSCITFYFERALADGENNG